MKFLYPRLSGVVILWFLLNAGASAQPYHLLTIDDFRGAPVNTNNGTIAYTNCTIDFRYAAQRANGFYRLNFNINLTLNHNKSWLARDRVTSPAMLKEILEHEQGHYLIAWMEQQELQRTVGKTVFHEDYQFVAQNIFDRIDAKYKQLNIDYDLDTQHMVNRVQQQSWDAYFKKRIAFMPQQ